ncbi:MAG: rod shape-determining protein RodA [Tannerella sp.]|jgi:rod shape determining protein RodA|nr:rod shape-determining protein RodA [Tannerella sp.]
MLNNKPNIWKSLDWFTVILYVLMVLFGWVSICGASYDFDNPQFFSTSVRPGMQLVWIGTSAVIIFMIMMLDKNFFETFAYPLYGFTILLLIATIFLAPDIKGSHSWLVITRSIRVQPAEFAKFATALALAKFMSTYEFKLLTVKNFTIASLLILLPMLCIVMQRETGSALVFLAFSIIFYREGMSGFVLLMALLAVIYFTVMLKYEGVMWHLTPVDELIVSGVIIGIILIIMRFSFNEKVLSKYFFLTVIVAGIASYITSYFVEFNFVWVTIGLIVAFSLILIFFAIKNLVRKYALIAVFSFFSIGFIFSVDYVFNNILEPHQQQRIKVSLGLKDDPSGAGYNVNQSKIAIGSGGFRGKGFLNGTQTKLKYVPEQDTDFIFCTVGEEFGFVGTLAVLLVYGAFLLRLIFLAERQTTIFGRVYGYGVVSLFFFHVAVNIGMVCGLLPVIGIPLPFFSYGGSSLCGLTILIFIFLRIDYARKENDWLA